MHILAPDSRFLIDEELIISFLLPKARELSKRYSSIWGATSPFRPIHRVGDCEIMADLPDELSLSVHIRSFENVWLSLCIGNLSTVIFSAFIGKSELNIVHPTFGVNWIAELQEQNLEFARRMFYLSGAENPEVSAHEAAIWLEEYLSSGGDPVFLPDYLSPCSKK